MLRNHAGQGRQDRFKNTIIYTFVGSDDDHVMGHPGRKILFDMIF